MLTAKSIRCTLRNRVVETRISGVVGRVFVPCYIHFWVLGCVFPGWRGSRLDACVVLYRWVCKYLNMFENLLGKGINMMRGCDVDGREGIGRGPT